MGVFDKDIIGYSSRLSAVINIIIVINISIIPTLHVFNSSTFQLEVSIWHVASTAAQSGTCSNAQLNVRKRAVLERRLLSPLQIELS